MFNVTQGCFQVTFANGITLSASNRYAFTKDGDMSSYIEVRAWTGKELEDEVTLPDEYAGSRIGPTQYLELANLLAAR